MVDVSNYPDDVIVAELGGLFRYSRCGSRNIDARVVPQFEIFRTRFL